MLSSDGKSKMRRVSSVTSVNILNMVKDKPLSRRDSVMSSISKKSNISPALMMTKNDKRKSGRLYDLRLKEKP